MRLQFIGCGDAFGSGGRFNTCFHVRGETANFLIDCGATAVVALKRFDVDRAAIDAILLTHFHADHFGGIPFFILDARFNARRTKPLTIAGPPGLRDWYARAMETAFPGSSSTPPSFELTLQEYAAGSTAQVGAVSVTPFPAVHDERAGPCLALRIACEGKVVTYSGDGEWNDHLADAARNADLFVCEGYSRDKPVKTHMTVSVLESHLAGIGARKVILTHLGEGMLKRRSETALASAEDGMIVEF